MQGLELHLEEDLSELRLLGPTYNLWFSGSQVSLQLFIFSKFPRDANENHKSFLEFCEIREVWSQVFHLTSDHLVSPTETFQFLSPSPSPLLWPLFSSGLGPIAISISMIVVSTYLPDHCHSGLEIFHHFLLPFLYFYFQDSKLPRTMLSRAMANSWSNPQLDTDTSAQRPFYSSPANFPNSSLTLL